MQIMMTVTAIERSPGHPVRINLANARNDYFAEITTYVEQPGVMVGQAYVLGLYHGEGASAQPVVHLLTDPPQVMANDHSEDLDPVKALGPRPC